MTVQDIIEYRGIQEILHFTTNRGVSGILATGLLKARSLLSKDKYLEHIYQYTCGDRTRDKEWWGYVNLSITSINRNLLGIASGKWYANADGWWCILSFSPAICCHEGVYFTTTNNMYSNGVKRDLGAKGLEAMFAPQITKWPGEILYRQKAFQKNQPTCEQAEILYPKEIPLKYLRKVYVKDDDTAAKYESIANLFPKWQHVPCEIHNNFFKE